MLAPQLAITTGELDKGLRNLMVDATFATAIGALNSGVMLLALALHLGASNLEIGLLAAIPLITQVLQAPTVSLVERLRKRRLISVAAVFAARLALPVYALVSFIPDRQLATNLLIAAALFHYGLNAVGACSWNSWIRDLVPTDRLGQFTARRSLFTTAVSAGGAIVAAVALQAGEGSEALSDWIFCGLYTFGFLCGIVSSIALARVPEPMMREGSTHASLFRLLVQPLRDRNFRSMLRFLASWQFAVNLATPFFTVYFVRGLGFSISFVLILTLVSQLATFAVLRGWGRLSDRFANKSVLSVAAPLFIACIASMILADEFATDTGRAAFLIGIHILMGFASAGVGIASGNIAMKLSPAHTATSYMATNALVSAVAAGMAPIVGGWAADFLARRRLEFSVEWTAPDGVSELLSFGLSHWEFFFMMSALVGVYCLHRLAAVNEQGEIERREVVQHIWMSARRTLRGMSPIGGLRLAVSFPGGALLEARQQRPEGRRKAKRGGERREAPIGAAS